MGNQIRKPECEICGVITSETCARNGDTMCLVLLLQIRHIFFNKKLHKKLVVADPFSGVNIFIVKAQFIDGLYIIEFKSSLIGEPADALIQLKIMVLRICCLLYTSPSPRD